VSAKDQVGRPPHDANRCLSDASDESAYEDQDMFNAEAKLPKNFKPISSLAISNKQIN